MAMTKRKRTKEKGYLDESRRRKASRSPAAAPQPEPTMGGPALPLGGPGMSNQMPSLGENAFAPSSLGPLPPGLGAPVAPLAQMPPPPLNLPPQISLGQSLRQEPLALPTAPAMGMPQTQDSPMMLKALANMATAAALKRDMANIAANGLPNYSGVQNQDRLNYGYAPGPYQYNMPAPGQPQDPEMAARGRIASQGRRASRTGSWEQRLLDAGMPEAPPELQRNPNLSLTPAQFKEQLAAARAAGQESPTARQMQTYQEVAGGRGRLPNKDQVIANLAAREKELADRQALVKQRGLVKGKAKELGVPPAVAAAMMGGEGQSNNLPQIFAHYFAMTGDPKVAADLAAMHHGAQDKNPLRDQLLALAGQSQDPAIAKKAFEMAQGLINGGQAGKPMPVLPGEDPQKTAAIAEQAAALFPKDLKGAVEYIQNALGIPLKEAAMIAKQTHPEGHRINPRAAAEEKQKMDLATANALGEDLGLNRAAATMGVNPADMHAWMAPIVGFFGNMLGNTDRANELNAGIQ